jgi:hypothetical protein
MQGNWSHEGVRRNMRLSLRNPIAISLLGLGIVVGFGLAGGVVLAASHARGDAAVEAEPPNVVAGDFTTGGDPADQIHVAYVPNGFDRSDDEVQNYDSGAQMHSQKYTGDMSSFDIEAIRRPEPLDRGSDLGFPTDVTRVSVGGHTALLLTASDGNDEVSVVEWPQGPTIIKVIGNHLPTNELLKIADGLSVTGSND